MVIFHSHVIGPRQKAALGTDALEPRRSRGAARDTQLLEWVKWPVPANGPVIGGILGDDPFGGALEKMNRKHSKQVQDLKECQIIFIPKTEEKNVNAILESLGANGLTVGESEGFAKPGGMIGFVMEGDQVRFEIYTGAARQAGLKIDLRLLKLPKRVFNS